MPSVEGVVDQNGVDSELHTMRWPGDPGPGGPMVLQQLWGERLSHR
ncbi:hypothetical protein [Streptomyces sp. NPDC058989]